MALVCPYIIVPNLIPQPTWGGEYIAHLKGISNSQNNQSAPLIDNLDKLGQSYELFSDTKLSTKCTTKDSSTIEIGNAKDPLQTQVHTSADDHPFNINQLITTNPQQVLGSKVLKHHGNKIDTLIKLTQAQENSYQLHVSQKVGDWVAKPESWYFLEPGLITLGVKPNINWKDYQSACQQIDQEAHTISGLIVNGQLSLSAGTHRLSQFIKFHNPRNFVNRLSVPKNCAVNLSTGGVHHSWESDSTTLPHGNIVYELQQNVFDPVSTIRAFDQGKIKPDGSVRDLNIEDYFNHIDHSSPANIPQNHISTKKVLKHTSTYTIRQIFDTKNYRLQQLTFSKSISNLYTTTSNSYHHLFVRSGNISLFVNNHHWTLTSGFSIFIPASVGNYLIKPYQSKTATVLKTYL